MLGLVRAVVAVLAIHLVLAHVHRVDEFDGLFRQVTLVHANPHQTLIAFHHAKRHHEDPEDGHKDHVVPGPGPEALEVAEVLQLRLALTLANGVGQSTVHA